MYILLIKFSRDCTDTRTYFIYLFIYLIIVMIYFLLVFFCYS